MEKTKSPEADTTTKPRIAPIEHPKKIKLKLAYWYSKRTMGKVITPLKVVQTRMPKTLSMSQKIMSVQDHLSLSDDLAFYIKSYVATLNGCSFCIDIAKAEAQDHVEIEKYEQLLNYESAAVFDDAEKAALQYVEQATLEKEVGDDVFNELRAHFNDKEIVEITWLNAAENYFNLINKPLHISSDELCRAMTGK